MLLCYVSENWTVWCCFKLSEILQINSKSTWFIYMALEHSLYEFFIIFCVSFPCVFTSMCLEQFGSLVVSQVWNNRLLLSTFVTVRPLANAMLHPHSTQVFILASQVFNFFQEVPPLILGTGFFLATLPPLASAPSSSFSTS